MSVGIAMNIFLKKIVGLSLSKKAKLPMMIKTINSFIMDTPYLVFTMMNFESLLF